ncbi:hypothetical protein [Mycobacterium sp. OTB74]|uniref:DUF7715 family protein n=1 Tax=Mycobacterium sp. OTB74 TaxID=1853452 RepID=UPI002475360E|nr:hypothetical protein [Mycobacterium sp. OTB74]MDH6245740.1 hypothetical protein [Mycobacterium sp. OTB74]
MTKILTIHRPEHPANNDFCHAIEGELAIPPLFTGGCACGCALTHIGVGSYRASTTLMVRNSKLTDTELISACVNYLNGAGWGPVIADLGDTPRDVAESVMAELCEEAAQHPIGTVLRPRYNRDANGWTYTTNPITNGIA